MGQVQQYPDVASGITATVQTLSNGFYPHIVQNLRSSIPSSQWDGTAAGEVSKWGTRTTWLGSPAHPPAVGSGRAYDAQVAAWWSWANGVLTGIGAPRTQTNYDTLWRWTLWEKPAGFPAQWNNPLNTEQPISGSTSTNSGHNQPTSGSQTGPSDPFGINSALSGFGGQLSKELVATVEVVGGVLLMLVGLGILVLMAFKVDPRSVPGKLVRTAAVATPQGRAVAAAGAVAKPAPKPLSPEAQSAVAAAKAGRGSKLSPAVKAELRGAA